MKKITSDDLISSDRLFESLGDLFAPFVIQVTSASHLFAPVLW